MQLLLLYRIPLFRHVSFTLLGLYNRLLTSDPTDREKTFWEYQFRFWLFHSHTNTLYGEQSYKYLIELFF